MAVRALAWLVLGALSACAGPSAPEARTRRFEFEHAQMGTLFRVVVHAGDGETARVATDAAFARLDELDARLSDFDPESELSLLARTSDFAVPTPWVPVSRDLARVLARAAEVARESGGAFDVTCGGATRLWRRAIRAQELPPRSLLLQARAATDWRAIELSADQRRVRLHAAGMRIDLGGIAKGYALDEMLAVLARHGLRSALVDGGGDVAVGEPPPGARGWRVLVRSLTEGDEAEPIVLELARAAVATSGDVYRSVVIEGRRYAHIVDPRTGMGLSTRAGASVVARDGMTADALATAAAVLGPEPAQSLWSRFLGSGGRVLARVSEASEALEIRESAVFTSRRAP